MPVAQDHRAADPGAGQVVVVAGVRRRDLAELGVDQRAVVALVVVLGDHLPVRRHLVGVPVGDHERARAVRRHDPSQLPQVVGEGRHLGAAQRVQGVAEHPALPDLHRQLHESVGARVEVVDLAEAGGRDQRPRQVVAPGVVGADHRRGASWTRPPAAARGRGAGRCWRTSAPRRSGAPAGRTRRPPTTARWVVPGPSRSASRPRQVQLPAYRCRRSQASTSGEV